MEEDVEESYTPTFRKKTSWVPKPSKCSTLEHVIDKIKSDVTTLPHTLNSNFYNLPPEVKEVIRSLEQRYDIIIKPAEKGKSFLSCFVD